MAHLNVRSLRSKIDEIRLLQELCNFDILAITESHLDSSVPDFHIEIEGLRFFRLDRPKRKGGGCVLYYAENLTVIYRRDLSDKNLEAIWIQVNFPSVTALFSVIYRAPDDNDFFDKFQKQLESAWLRSSYIFLLGDLNCDLNILNTVSRNKNTAKLLSIFDALNLENTITSPTRVTPTCESLIDLIVTSKKELIHSSGVFHLGISDHSLIHASIRLTQKRPPAKIIKTRNYKNFNEANFQQDISFAPFHVASVFDDPDDKLWAWNKLFLDVCDQHAPLKDVNVRSSSLPWITNSIRLKINRRYKLSKLAVNTKCPQNWSEHKRIQNEITTDLRQAKAMYFNELFTEIKTTRAYWNLVRKATAPKKQTVVGPLKTESGHLVVKDDEKACLMNTYFASVGEKLALDLPPSIMQSLSSDLVTQTKIVPSLSKVNLSEVGILRQIKHLKSNKATGPDGISPKLLKLASHAVSPHLTSLFRRSIHHETAYEGWKLTRVSPIFKKDDSTDPGNYRPISILSVPSKLLESEINTAIVNHVTNNNLITPNQWAYRKAHSTELLLIHLTEKWRKFVDDGLTVAVAFVDFRKAFDSVLHSRLLDKLHGQFGIDGELYAWMDSYLSNRK